MIKLKNFIFDDVAFQTSLLELNSKEGLPVKTLYTLAKLARRLKQEVTIYADAKKSIFEELGEKDKKGNLVPKKETKEELEKRVKELQEIEFEIDVNAVPFDEKMNLTVSDIIALEGVILEPKE